MSRADIIAAIDARGAAALAEAEIVAMAADLAPKDLDFVCGNAFGAGATDAQVATFERTIEAFVEQNAQTIMTATNGAAAAPAPAPPAPAPATPSTNVVQLRRATPEEMDEPIALHVERMKLLRRDHPNARLAPSSWESAKPSEMNPPPWEPPGIKGGNKIRFELIRFADLTLGDEPEHLVEDLIPREALVVVWGPPKQGKSFWVFDLMMHVALGWMYRGREVQQGPVVYCAFEGAKGFKKRKAAFCLRHEGVGDPDFFLVGGRSDLIREHAALIADIRSQVADKRPVAVVLDTLNRSLVGSESKDEDMTKYIAAADAIREAFPGCTVIIVHHCGLDGTRPRGHTSLSGATDCQIEVGKDDAGHVITKIELVKEGEEGDTLASRLKVVEVGRDKRGKPITSCVVEAVEDYEAPLPARQKSSKAADPIRDAITEALETGKRITPRPGMAPALAAKLADVLAIFERRYVVTAKDNTPDKIKDAKRQAFNRAIKKLPASEFDKGEVDGGQWIWRVPRNENT